MTPPLKNPSELVARLDLEAPGRVLLVDPPTELVALTHRARARGETTRETSSESIRSVKEKFDAILVWRVSRTGSRSLLENAVKRLAPDGFLWVVTALKKVRGPSTPAVHRLELSDLVKGFADDGLTFDREVRVSPWHVAYRFSPLSSRLSPLSSRAPRVRSGRGGSAARDPSPLRGSG